MITHTDERTSIPAELRERRQWMTWTLTDDGRKLPNGKSNTPDTWHDFTTIEIFDNIAYVIAPDDPYTGIDLDGCIVDGQWTEWSKPILDRFAGVAYGEISPSGTGVKLTTRATKPDGARCTHKIAAGKQQIECYDHDRFWTVTANVVDGFGEIGDGQAAVDWLCETYLSGEQRQTGTKRTEAYGGTSSLTLLQRSQAYADKMAPASKGDLRNAAFRNAGHLHAIVGALGERLTDSDVYHLLRAWNARNSEQLRDDELLEAAANGRKNGTPPADKPPGDSAGSVTNLSQTPQPVLEPDEGPGFIPPAIISIGELIMDHPDKRPPVIHGICRRGEVVNVIGASKAGKSWLIAGMLQSVALGRDWLGHDVEPGRVLLIDNELHREELAHRLHRIAYVSKVDVDDLSSRFDIMPLRGGLTDIGRLRQRLGDVKPGTYSLVALDAFYRFLPEGTSENDNAQMMALYNALDAIAADLECAIVLNHHASKGDQSSKAVTDVGSGAGSISRAADTHLIIRPHEMETCAVLEGVCRSWAPMEPRTIRWEWPLWHLSEIEPAVRQPAGRQKREQSARDEESDRKVLDALQKHGRLTPSELRGRCGWGADRVNRTIARLLENEAIRERKVKHRRTGKTRTVFALIEGVS